MFTSLLLNSINEIGAIYLIDALKAFFPAVARIMLGWKAEPHISSLATAGQKIGAVIGSIAFAVWMGDMARSFASTVAYASLIVGAAAFTAQDAAHRLIVLSNPALRVVEKRAKKLLGGDS